MDVFQLTGGSLKGSDRIPGILMHIPGVLQAQHRITTEDKCRLQHQLKARA